MATDDIGDFVAYTTAQGIEIVQADPRIRVCAGLLDLSIPCDHPHSGKWWGDVLDLVGDVLTITGHNRKVIYRVDWSSYDPDNRTLLAVWPD